MQSFLSKSVIYLLTATFFLCDHLDSHEADVNWNLWFVNNLDIPVTISIWNDETDTSSIRNIDYYYNQDKNHVIFNTNVSRTDSEQNSPLIINPGKKTFFTLRYKVSNIYSEPQVEGFYQFFERIAVRNGTTLKDSVFVSLFRFPDDSLKIVATSPYSTDPVSKWKVSTTTFTDTIYLYLNSLTGTPRYLKWKSY